MGRGGERWAEMLASWVYERCIASSLLLSSSPPPSSLSPPRLALLSSPPPLPSPPLPSLLPSLARSHASAFTPKHNPGPNTHKHATDSREGRDSKDSLHRQPPSPPLPPAQARRSSLRRDLPAAAKEGRAGASHRQSHGRRADAGGNLPAAAADARSAIRARTDRRQDALFQATGLPLRRHRAAAKKETRGRTRGGSFPRPRAPTAALSRGRRRRPQRRPCRPTARSALHSLTARRRRSAAAAPSRGPVRAR